MLKRSLPHKFLLPVLAEISQFGRAFDETWVLLMCSRWRGLTENVHLATIRRHLLERKYFLLILHVHFLWMFFTCKSSFEILDYCRQSPLHSTSSQQFHSHLQFLFAVPLRLTLPRLPKRMLFRNLSLSTGGKWSRGCICSKVNKGLYSICIVFVLSGGDWRTLCLPSIAGSCWMLHPFITNC